MIATRDQWETDLARSLSRLSQRQLNRLMESVGDPPDLNKITPEFWNEYSTAMRGELLPTLEKIFLGSAEDLLGTTSIGVDWALVNQEAARWARSYGYDLVRGITDNTRNALRDKTAAFFEQGLNLRQLRDSLESLFGPVRAEMLAATEVTRAAAQGEAATVREIEKSGIAMVPVWNTNNDAIVRRCPICWPRHGKKQGDGWIDLPPAHPRCRCWCNYEFAMEGKVYQWSKASGDLLVVYLKSRKSLSATVLNSSV